MEKNWSTVQLHCRECNARMMDYTLCQDDDRIVLQGITIKCNRCKRVMMFKKCTEGMIRKLIGMIAAVVAAVAGVVAYKATH